MKKLFVSIILCFLFIGTIFPIGNASANEQVTTSALGFKDVGSGNTFINEITYLTSKGIIKGFPDGTFRPDAVVNRPQAVIMIGRALGWDGTPRKTKYPDVPASMTGSGYIASASEKGILDLLDFSDGFAPHYQVYRGDMAILIDKSFNLPTSKTNPYTDLRSYNDAYQSILNVSATGIANGYTDGTFDEYGYVTRGQFSAFLTRALDPSYRSKQENSRSNPADIGETAIVEKDDWLDGHQKYEVELKQIISGDQAWRIVKAGNMFNSPPDTGMHYILAKFRIKVLELEKEPFDINHAKFDAISKNGVKYTDFISLSGINPSLRTDLYKGAEYEGWTYFMVNDGDKPLAVFNQGWDDEVWFDISN